jgi:hypothetical protein
MKIQDFLVYGGFYNTENFYKRIISALAGYKQKRYSNIRRIIDKAIGL